MAAVSEQTHSGTRERLLDAAAELVSAAPGEDFSLRAVCDRAGVQLPTLYHFFGNKDGLVEAVVERGFELYLRLKQEHPSSGDPVQDLRDGWDAHVAFGLANPGFYSLMYGTVRPGSAPRAQEGPNQVLRALTGRAADQGRLVVDPDQAAAHVLAANVGVTLRQIVRAEADPALSAAVRDATIAAITGTSAGTGAEPRDDLRRAAEHAAARPEVLGEAETRLLMDWLGRLAGGLGASH